MLWVGIYAQPQTPNVVVKDSVVHLYKDILKTDSLLKNTNIQTDNLLFEKKWQENFRKNYQTEDFDYSASKPKTSFWERLTNAVNRLLEYIFGDINGLKVNQVTEAVVNIIAILSLAILLYVLIVFLMKKDGNWIFGKRNSQISIPSNDIVENIHEINFPQTIAKYEQEKDFRSAIRYQFLYMLKKLTDSKQIEWNPEKTNKEYLMEIQKSDLQKQFKEAAYIFDYVWYGEFSVDQNTYEKYKNEHFNW